MNKITITNSNIKGYHFFKRKPHPVIGMVVEPEIGNKYDADAMVIKMPNLENIPIRYHDEMLPSSTERVKDISGKVIGRVPANICKLFRELLDRGYISSVLCFCIDNLSHSKHPHYSQAYQKRTGKYDRQGGVA